MIEIKNYMNDGADWQAQMVLIYLRSHYEDAVRKSYSKKWKEYLVNIKVGRYENCREQGYVFSIWYKGNQRNYAVYEHRNSDTLCVLISNSVTLNTPSIDDMWRDKGENPSKYDYDEGFGCGEVVDCANFILEDMDETISDWMKDAEIE